MKKINFAIALLFCLAGFSQIFGATWDNNEYQRKSRAFSALAAAAYDEGAYDEAVQYARDAELNAELSAAYIRKMIDRTETENLLFKAHTRLSWAKEKRAEKFFPEAVESASALLASADAFFAAEDYSPARTGAADALSALAVVREISPLPAQYLVRPWAPYKDCFWNIAANPAVYGDPFLWKELYKANRKSIPSASNPNLVEKGTIITIPSIRGEYREGIYDPSLQYEPFGEHPR